MNLNAHYQESGQINFPKTVITLLLAIPVVFVLAYLYVVLTVFIPFIYLNALIALAVGAIIGLMTRGIVRMGHVRNRIAGIGIALILCLLAYWVQWVCFSYYVNYGSSPTPIEFISEFLFMAQPNELMEVVMWVYENGTWGIGSGSSTVSGIILAVVWLVELAMIAGAAVVVMLKWETQPYVEKLNTWYGKFELEPDFEAVPGITKFKEGLQLNAFETVSGLGLGNGLRSSNIYVYYNEMADVQYLSVENVSVSTGEKKETTKEMVLSNFEIPTAHARQIIENIANEEDKIALL